MKSKEEVQEGREEDRKKVGRKEAKEGRVGGGYLSVCHRSSRRSLMTNSILYITFSHSIV